MFPCFFGGFLSRLVCSDSRALMRAGLVSRGSIMSSRYPRAAATYGCANFSRYSSILASVAAAGSLLSRISLRKRISTAPFGPITAISAVGQATLKSPRMCLELITSYAPPYAFRVIGNNVEQRLVTSIARVGRRSTRRIGEIVRRNEAEQVANPLKALRLRVKGEVCYARLGRMSVGTPQILHRHVFVGHGLNDVGSRHEHVRCAAHHIREVGDRRRINGAAGAGAEHRRDPRNYTGSKRIAKEDLRVAAERDDSFLDTRATRVVETDDRRAVANGEIHDLHDLLGERFRQRSDEYRSI